MYIFIILVFKITVIKIQDYLNNLDVQEKRKFHIRYNRFDLENPVKIDLPFIGSRHANNSFYLYGDITMSATLID